MVFYNSASMFCIYAHTQETLIFMLHLHVDGSTHSTTVASLEENKQSTDVCVRCIFCHALYFYKTPGVYLHSIYQRYLTKITWARWNILAAGDILFLKQQLVVLMDHRCVVAAGGIM